MQEFYGKHDVLTKLQYGFQPNKSCTQLLSDFTDSVNAHLNDKKHVFALFIDYSKAFDVLDHKKLSQKLHASGIRGPLLKWCDSYVANRCSYVKICNSLSKRSVATHGTAQGSVIGPLHFLVYVNDLVNVLKHCQVYQFADDTCIISADRNVKDAISKLQKDFDRLCMWSHDSGLVLNAQKTKMVHIHSPHIKNDQLIELKAHSHSCLHLRTQSCKCESIELVKSQRYLGLVIDEHFSWGPHIDGVNNRLQAILAKIYIIRNRLTFHTLYKALVEPVVDYGLSSYGRTFKSYLEPLLNLQTRIIKNIVGPKIKNKFRENCNGLFKHCAEAELEGDAWRVYDYITRHFIATLSRDCRYLSNCITFQIGSETFSYTGNTLVDAGYTEIMHWQALGKDEFVPLLKVDDVLRAHDHRLVECQTAPPDYLTESEVTTLDYLTESEVTTLDYLTESEVTTLDYLTESEVTTLDYLTESEVTTLDYLTESEVTTLDYLTESEVTTLDYLTESEVTTLDYLTESEVTTLDYLTESEVTTLDYLTESEVTTLDYLTESESDVTTLDYLTVSEVTTRDYLTESEVTTLDYLTELEVTTLDYLTESEVTTLDYLTESEVTTLDYLTESEVTTLDYLTESESEITTLDYLTESEVTTLDYLTESEVTTRDYLTESEVTTLDYLTESEVTTLDYLTESEVTTRDYLTESEVTTLDYLTESEVTTRDYLTESEVTTLDYLTESEVTTLDYLTESEVTTLDYLTESEVTTLDYLTESEVTTLDYLTESEVITLMEKHGIGTDASIPVHINNICQRNYVTVGSGRRLVPTNLGIVLVHGYQKIDPELVLPTMRSAVEEQLNLIAVGKADFHAVLSHTTEIFRRKFQHFARSIEAMDQLFEVNFSSLKASGKALSRCGKCRRYMRYIMAKPARLHCSHCDDTYCLPQNGTVRIYRELKCPLDDFELLSWSSGNKGKSFPLCPYCYNHPPFRDMKKGFGCNSCTHPTCPYGVNSTGVSGCVECESGVLVLDPSAPKWKLGCNRCDVIINIFEDASRVTVSETQCNECSAQLVTAEYRAERTRLPGAITEMTACLFCDPAFIALVEKHRAVASRASAPRGGRGGDARAPPNTRTNNPRTRWRNWLPTSCSVVTDTGLSFAV
ncbi:unnamed protein product [Plutella xylostella]|uniref:DNA topoisomerase n=1 Tax=Plutella xylostella TaxID=51655 RepID=A0A8S4FLD6_PLUXY|nr:unnamed protein product [Plutella xylostella]